MKSDQKLGVDLTSILLYNILHAREMRVMCKYVNVNQEYYNGKATT